MCVSNKRPLAGPIFVGLLWASKSLTSTARVAGRAGARRVSCPVVGPLPSNTARRHNNWRRGCSSPWLRPWQKEPAHLEAAGGSDWKDARHASALVSLLGREGQRKYFAAAEQEEARTTLSNAASAQASDPESSAPATLKFDSLVKQLDRLFAASTNPLVKRHEFTSQRQLPTESFLDYVTVLKAKAVQCKFGFGLTCAERVHDQIIHGTSNPRLRVKLLAYGEELSLKKAEEIGRTFEALSLANQAFAPRQPEHVQAKAQGAQYGGAKKMARADGKAVTSLKFRKAKMATFSSSQGPVLQFGMRS
ncbi:hypothetical protein HPB52_012956 [Rhipicephalus sanguineus]|uniref:Uncharacterized protein n=1 Tax=Rhipicephalus sanguineus TaxID=34632 RepID=A0A9D4SX98_RHISA|nr:hypothetical protein HPB52_012956 [Rhipicephalus sanguineus]